MVMDRPEVLATLFSEVILAVVVGVCRPVVQLVLVLLVFLLQRPIRHGGLVREVVLSAIVLDDAVARILGNVNRTTAHPRDDLLSSILHIYYLSRGLLLSDRDDVFVLRILAYQLPVRILRLLDMELQEASSLI